MNQMRNRAMQLEIDFKNFLIENGFPEDSILYEPRFHDSSTSSAYFPDFAIIDPKTKDPLAVIEVKISKDRQITPNRINPLIQKFNSVFGKTNVRLILALGDAGEKNFTFYNLNNNSEFDEDKDRTLFKFKDILRSNTAEKLSIINDTKKATSRTFFYICYFFVIVVILFIIADFISSSFNIKILTTERITALGITIVLAIFPYAQKLKFLGIEFERYAGKAE